MWLCIPCRAILIAILSPSSQFGSPRSPDIECSCNSGPSAKKKAENHPEDTGYIQMPYFWGNGLKQIRIKTIFFFEVDFETWINGFLGKFRDTSIPSKNRKNWFPNNKWPCWWFSVPILASSSSSSSSSNITNHHQPFIDQHHHHRKRSMCQNHEISKELSGEITASRCYPGCWRWYREPPPRSRDRLRHVFYCLWIGFINNQQEPRTNLNHLLLYGESLLAWWIEPPWYLAMHIGQQNLKL